VPGLELGEHPLDDARRRAVGEPQPRFAPDVVLRDRVNRDADEPEHERGEHAGPVLPARAMEEDAAFPVGEKSDRLGEARRIELERLAIEEPVPLGCAEPFDASE
jgi:hypothetical protein